MGVSATAESSLDSSPQQSANSSAPAPANEQDVERFDTMVADAGQPQPSPQPGPAPSPTPSSSSQSPSTGDVLSTGAQVVGGFIPGVGEAMDVYTLVAPDSSWLDRGLSVVSLGANVLTGGLAPNFGGWAKAARGLSHGVEALPDLMRAGRNMDEVLTAARGAGRNLDEVVDAAKSTGRLDELVGLGKLSPDEITSLRQSGRLTDEQANQAIDATRRANPSAGIPSTRYEAGGSKGAWSQTLNSPQPNTRYVVDGRYTYQTDAAGRVERVSGELQLNAADRNTYQQTKAGGADRLATDDGGHLVGSQFGGPGEALNLVAQNSGVNRSGGQWYAMETEWANALRNGQRVNVDVQPHYSGNNLRPTGFEVNYTIDGVPFQRSIPNP